MDIHMQGSRPAGQRPASGEGQVPLARPGVAGSPAMDSARALTAFPPPVPVSVATLPSWQAGRSAAKARVADIVAQQGYAMARRMTEE